MSAFELGMKKFCVRDFVKNGGLNITGQYPRHVVRSAWQVARRIMGV